MSYSATFERCEHDRVVSIYILEDGTGKVEIDDGSFLFDREAMALYLSQLTQELR